MNQADPAQLNPGQHNPAQLCLQARDDLIIVPQQFGGRLVYIVEDPIGGKYHRLGAREYAFFCCLNGATSVTAAAERVALEYPFTVDEALALCRWFAVNELLRPQRNVALAAERSATKGRRWWLQNPLFIRIPLGTPDRLLNRVSASLGWWHHPLAVGLVMALASSALLTVMAQWDRFAASAHEVFSPSSRIQLLLTWVLLKLGHELGHGLVCQRYGGYVREAGIQLILFTPMPYVDVSSSWKFRSKWQRIHTALAGVYVELAVAGIAAWTWNFTDSGAVHQACAHIVVTVALATVLFNANPLMRGDGYYVLSDLLEIPNLAPLGRQYWHQRFKQWLFGVQAPPSRPVPRSIRIYGVAALIWKSLVAAGLLLAATRLLHGAGLALVIVALTTSTCTLASRLRSYLREPPPGEHPTWRTFATRVGLLAAGLTTLLLWAPAPFAPAAPGVIEYSPPTLVRAAAPGFLRVLHVSPGQAVVPGQLLFELENDELVTELKMAELEIAKAEIRARIHRQRHEMAACQAVEKELEALHTQCIEKQREVDALKIRAPIAGNIVARHPDQMLGTFIPKGHELCLIGTKSAKEVRLLVHQDDVERFESRLGRRVQIRAAGRSFAATLERVTPRATSRLEYPALASPNGGPLTVRLTEATNDEKPQAELLEPRFMAIAHLDRSVSEQLYVGQLCRLTLPAARDRLWTAVARQARSWYRAKTGLAN